MGEKSLNIKGQIRSRTLYFIILAAIASIIVKTVLSKELIFSYIITEIVGIILLVLIKFNEPEESSYNVEDNNLNKYYNKSFKMFTKVIVSIYFLSLTLLYKNIANLYFIPGLFINSYFTILLLSSIYSLLKYQVYVNGCVISSNKSTYYKYVFSNILKCLAFTVIIALGITIVNIVIANLESTLFILLTLLIVLIVNITYYLLYSVYEYNKYQEMVMLEKKHHPIFSKNMFLYLSIVLFVITLRKLVLIGIFENLNFPSVINNITIFLNQIMPFFAIVMYIFLFIIIYSLKASLKRLKEKDLNLINIMFYLSVTITKISLILYLINPLIRVIDNNAIESLVVLVNYIVLRSSIVIFGLFNFYSFKHKFPKRYFLFIPTILMLALIIMSLTKPDLNNLTFYLSINLGIEVLMFASLIYISNIYSKPFEMIVEVY